MISIIVATANNLAIGRNNELPWNIPLDMKWFIKNTKGKPCLMGRNTAISIGKPLPNRQNIVLTRTPLEGFPETASSIRKAMKLIPEGTPEVMIIGGVRVYQEALAIADRIYLTDIELNVPDADAFFPQFQMNDWSIDFEEHHNSTESTPDFVFYELNRKK